MCDPNTGQCIHTPAPNSTPCPDTDGDLCTIPGCNGTIGSAGGAIIGCDQIHNTVVCPPDGNPCTDDAGCVPGTGQCSYPNTQNSTPCPDNDGNPCTTAGCDGLGTCDQSHIMCVTTTTVTTTTTTVTTTTTTVPSCIPTGPEAGNCNDTIDNDCDGKIDCSDTDCTTPAKCQGGTQDGQDCSTAATLAACTAGVGICPCPPILKDPTTITFGKNGALDRLKSHGRVDIPGTVDVLGSEVGWLLSKDTGRIFGVSVPPNTLLANNHRTRFRTLVNPLAKTQGGIYKATVTVTRHGVSYGYRVEAYGNMSLATDPHMAIQFYVGNQPTSAIHTEMWERTKTGWKAHGFQ
jgi:hypothetical protein